MNRPEIIQSFVDRFDAARYLEVGVSQGATFHSVSASRKVAVDPNFLFPIPDNPINESVQYHVCTSDSFFANCASGEKFDVIYLDGLHTYEQTLRDLLSAIVMVSDRGVIIVDDMIPTSYTASLRDPDLCFAIRRRSSDQDLAWMGDVYKLAFFVETFLLRFDFRVTSDDHGQMVLWRSARKMDESIDRRLSEISNLDYSDTITLREHFKLETIANIFQLTQPYVGSISPS